MQPSCLIDSMLHGLLGLVLFCPNSSLPYYGRRWTSIRAHSNAARTRSKA